MDYSQRHADPKRHLVGLGIVILFHVLVVWALVSGLAKKVVDVVRAPIETKVIEEIKKPPPPPEVVVPPPPKLEAPPPPQPTITATTPTPPPAPVVIAPAPPPAAPAPPAPPAPAVASAGVVCSNYATKMGEVAFPREAVRQGIERGEATIQFTLTAGGEVKDIKAIHSTHQIFARNSIRIVSEYKCQGQGRDVTVTVPFAYNME